MEEVKIRPLVDVIDDSFAMVIQRAGQFDHGKREVDSIDAREVRRKGLRQSANAATEVEGSTAWNADVPCAQLMEDQEDFVDAGLKETVEVPATPFSCRVGENRPQRVALRVAIPELPALAERVAHGGDMRMVAGRWASHCSRVCPQMSTRSP